MCNVGQVVVSGAPGKLLQFAVGQVESPARGSLLQRLLHAPAGRYCGRQLGSIPSSHQTHRSASSFYFLSNVRSTFMPRGCVQTPHRVLPQRSWLKSTKVIPINALRRMSCDCPLHTTGELASTNNNRERFNLSIFQEVASSFYISQQEHRKLQSSLKIKAT